jgi:hypothetical protein
MDIFNVTDVRACIYRISSADDYRIDEFDGTENMENRDYDRICGCYVPLVGICHITKFPCFNQYGWYDCGGRNRSKFYMRIAHKPTEGGENNGRN